MCCSHCKTTSICSINIGKLSPATIALFSGASSNNLLAWLNALSDEAKQKQEWRYWMAKTTAQASDKEAKQHLEALSKDVVFIQCWLQSN